jgi:hypothetical protein
MALSSFVELEATIALQQGESGDPLRNRHAPPLMPNQLPR